MKLRLAQPKFLIDIGRLPGLSDVREDNGAIRVGGLVTHHTLETSDVLKSKLPLLPETAAHVADVQVRNRGTIGGSLVHADPAADLPAAALALGAELHVVGPRGERTIKAADFFVGLLATAIAPDEILTDVRFPLPPPKTGAAYVKVPNKASHYAIVGVAAVVTLDGNRRCEQARIGLTGVTHVPSRAEAAENALAGEPLDEGAIAGAAALAADGIKALNDIHASAEFRLHLTRVMTGRALKLAATRA